VQNARANPRLGAKECGRAIIAELLIELNYRRVGARKLELIKYLKAFE
jgi:hypothetical protein